MPSLADYKLFTPFQLNKDLELKNRMVVGPATRARADIDTRIPNERMCVYYEQRTSAGLIITEGVGMSEQGYGWYGAPALYTDEHAAGWKKVVDRVHAKNGTIFLQLWHLGRLGHPSFSSKNEVVSASATKHEDGQVRNANGDHVAFATARALDESEIPAIVDDYRKCAELAKAVGFDGVEVHGANGYFVDQFLQSVTNLRTDKYGGSFENRYRLLGEIVDAVKTVFPANRVAVRLSPNGSFGGMGSPDNFEMFTYAMERLSVHGLAYLAILDGFGFGYTDKAQLVTAADAKKAFKGTVIASNSYARESAEAVLGSGSADLVSFVRPFMANPDLVQRFQRDWPLNAPLEYEFYWDPAKREEGYISIPFFNKAEADKAADAVAA